MGSKPAQVQTKDNTPHWWHYFTVILIQKVQDYQTVCSTQTSLKELKTYFTRIKGAFNEVLNTKTQVIYSQIESELCGRVYYHPIKTY